MTEFSRILKLSDLATQKTPLVFEATADECRAIAERLGLQSLSSLVSEVSVTEGALGEDGLFLDGSFQATFQQLCVVSLKPLDQKIHSPFCLRILQEEEPPFDAENPEDLMQLAFEEVETLYLGDEEIFDMGEVLVQYLSVDLDPYPRDPGAVSDSEDVAPVHVDQPRPNPFEKLKDLKK